MCIRDSPFTYHVGKEVETAAKLLSGETFANVNELKSILTKNPRPLARNLLHQFTLYATGAPVRFSERKTIEDLLDGCEPDGYRVGDLLYSFCSNRLFAP